ncbi:MAG: hypothetical protein ACTSU7_15095, partial [Candidatus Heimdallarchaeaceae archaeon]
MAELFDDITIANYQLIKEKYQTQYIPYYEMMSQLNSNTKQGLGKIIFEALTDIKKTLPILDKVLQGKATKEDVEALNKTITQIQVNQVRLAKLAETSSKFRRESEKVAKFVNIPFKDIMNVRKSAQESERIFRKNKEKRPGPLEEIRKAENEISKFGFLRSLVYGGGMYLGAPSVGRMIRGSLGAASGLLGPLAPLVAPAVGLAGGLGYGAYKLGKGIRALTKGKFVPSGILRPGEVIEERPGEVEKPIQPLTSEGVKRQLEQLGQPREIVGRGVLGATVGAFRARTRRQKEEATEPLFYFFNK